MKNRFFFRISNASALKENIQYPRGRKGIQPTQDLQER